ncbi:MAG: sulfatase [Thermodesulfobacteriota bacterium]
MDFQSGMSRRAFITNTLGAAATLAHFAGCSSAVKPPLARNVILVVTDTLRRDAVECYDSGWVKTPNLGAFAKRAHVFSNAHVASFPTVPHRNDLLTGTYTFTYKAWSPINPGSVTLQETLGASGIRTALVADTPHPFTADCNYQRGFHSCQLIRGQETDPWRVSPEDVRFPCSPHKLRDPYTTVIQHLRNTSIRRSEEDCFVAQTMKTAAKFLEEVRGGTRFFLYVDTFDPHEPWDPPKHYVRMYEEEDYQGEEVIYPKYDRWSSFLSVAELQHCRMLYAAETTLVDKWIGYLLGKIEDLGMLTDTAVVITSDHGFYLGEHGYIGKSLIREGAYQDLPLWPEVSGIPLIMHVPGIPGGKIHAPLVQPPDLMPTVLELMGIPCPRTVKGTSLVGTISGKRDSLRQLSFSSPTIWIRGRDLPMATARTTISDGGNMLVLGPSVKKSSTRERETTRAVDDKLRDLRIDEKFEPEFYDLRTDPQCQKNLLSSKLPEAQAMRKEFVAFLKSQGVPDQVLKYYRELA